jgi:SAM-dependent methyltransferase
VTIPAGGEAAAAADASVPPALSDALQTQSLERFERHRRVWAQNGALRALNAALYERVRRELPPRARGRWVELGAGPGFARDTIPDMELTDLVRAPWLDRQVNAEAMPFDDRSVGALVLFDVLHHLPSPRRFFEEATRVLAPGGRIVMCEPYISPVSYPVYKFLHDEPLDLSIDPLALADGEGAARDPFDANQGIPTVLFGRKRRAFTQALPGLAVARIQYMSGFSCPASGGFSHGPFLPWALWSLLHRIDGAIPSAIMRWMAFRMLVVIERR